MLDTLFNLSPRTIGDAIHSSETFAVGGGQWSKEFYSREGEFLFEIVGENGTQCSIEEMEQSSRMMEEDKLYKCAELLPLDTRINLRSDALNHSPATSWEMKGGRR